jgi:hypothetical protein
MCPKGHKYHWKCHKGAPKICPVCLEEAIEEEKRKVKDFELEAKRQMIQSEHARKLSEISKRMEEQRQILKDIEGERERRNVLAQKVKDLENLKAAVDRAKQPQPDPEPHANVDGNPTPSPLDIRDLGTKREIKGSLGEAPLTSAPSAAKDEWERQKRIEGQSNEALDSLMDMIGLEEVKNNFLSIKAKVDTVVRQGVSLKDERFSAALLGNPGTGTCQNAQWFMVGEPRKLR